MNIRTYIKKNLSECTKEEIKETILASVNCDEVILPGLGVLFEMLWNNSSNEFKVNIINIISDETKKA